LYEAKLPVDMNKECQSNRVKRKRWSNKIK
jgi:hypothetical protein